MAQLTLKEEKRLLKRLHRCEEAAFAEFYRAFAPRLFRAVILPRVGVEDLAEDILRETFLTAFEKIKNVSWQGKSLFYWLSRIAQNKIIDMHRKLQRTRKFVEGYTPFLELLERPENPEESFLREETSSEARKIAKTLLDGLNPRYRSAIEMRFLEGMSREACAEALEVSLGNFDVILFRALKRMRTLFERLAEESHVE